MLRNTQVLIMRLQGILVALALLAGAHTVEAASTGSKNKEGNRLFEQGKFEEAQKAYQEAQLKNPGRAELLYNTGNTLIKQRKYDQALQQLNQAIAKADKGLQSWSWYNTGNALYEMGRYQDSARAFIESLKIDPSDRDAKHNLELALKRLKQQQQNRQGPSQQPKSEGEQKQEPDKSPETKTQQPPPGKEDSPNDQQDPKKPVQPQATRGEGGNGKFSKERALQILDALENQELAEQRKLQKKGARRKVTGKDW